ncbi:MAG: trimeric autotransporter adhesin [Candidatus Parcubacteria bacterium]|jgi:hypothetical protein
MIKSTNKSAAALLGAVALVLVSTTMASAANCSYVFTKTLKRGSTGAEVMNLQKVLNLDTATQVAASGAGSAGNETMTFGPATYAAVVKFQALKSVSPTSGLVGPLTRAELNKVCTGTGTTTGGTTTGGTTASGPVSVSNGSSVSATLVDDSVGAVLGSFVFSGNGTVTGVELQRTGVSTDQTLRNVYLYDGATRLTDAASVITGGAIRFNSPSGIFSVNGSKTITVRADIGDGFSNTGTPAGSTNGQQVGVKVNSITTLGGTTSTVSGVMTNNQTIASVTNVATVVLSGSAQAATVNAGVMNQNLWSRTAAIGQRAVNLRGITFKYVGSAPTDAVTNIGLFIDGVKVGSGSVNSNNRVVFDMTSSPLVLNTGNRLIELRGDVVKGSFRSFEFSVENQADFMIEDSSLAGVMVGPTLLAGGIAQNVQGGLYTISAGTLTVNQDPAFTTTKVVGGTANQTISKFKLQAYGEDVKVETLVITPVLTGATPAAAGLQNVSLFVNDAAVGSSQNWSNGALTFNLGSSLIVPAGTSVLLSVKADTKTTGGADYTAGTVSADITSAGTVARGQSSQNTVTVNGQPGRLLTVGSATAVFSKTGGFVNSIASPNTGNVKVGSFTVTAGDIEDIVVTNLKADFTGSSASLTNVSALKLGGTDSSVIYGQPTTTGNNFSMNVTVPKNTSRTFDVYADIGSATPGSNLIVTGTLTYRGAINGNSTPSSAVTGATLTFNTATIPNANITRLSTSPVSQLVVGGSSNQALVTYNVKANSGTATIQELTFSVNALADNTDRIVAITVGGVTKQVTGATLNVISGLNIAVPEGNSGVDVPVTVTYGTVRQPNGGVSADTTASTGITLTGFKAISGNTQIESTTLAVASNLMQLVSTKPVVTVNQTTAASGLSIGENKIGEVTVQADAAGNLSLTKLNFDLSLSGIATGTVTGCKLVEGTSGSIAVSGSSVAACSTSAADFTFSGTGYTVAAGTSKTFSVYATIGGTLGTSGQSAISSKLEAGSTGFAWTDVNAASAALTGANIFNYPTNSWSVKN